MMMDGGHQNPGGDGASSPWPQWLPLRPAQWRRSRWFLLAVIGGVVLMVTGNWLSGNPSRPPAGIGPGASTGLGLGAGAAPPPGAGNTPSITEVEAHLASLLTRHLAQVDGAGPVHVLVSLATGEEQVFAADQERTERRTEESDGQGGRRLVSETDESVHVLWQPGLGGAREPIRRTVRGPRVGGVLVVARGAADAQVRLHLIRGVQALLDVPLHRIAIVPGGEVQ